MQSCVTDVFHSTLPSPLAMQVGRGFYTCKFEHRHITYWQQCDVNPHSQLDWIVDHHRSPPARVSMKMFPERLNWGGKTSPECGWCCLWSGIPDWIKRESKPSTSFLSACFLTVGTVPPDASRPCCYDLASLLGCIINLCPRIKTYFLKCLLSSVWPSNEKQNTSVYFIGFLGKLFIFMCIYFMCMPNSQRT